ncbi:hypothetical protein ED92_11075 [Amycolatopsis sp. MJM2582]|uniref:hypothetical protein n=1 Tax=Amycolatopsis sp. MJM2582 TaxID=1427749 RepID=UPI00050264B6|nr:hypothetical protein [Amycolatopsis sp. MJM2582]KFZ80854.1 hypothetical protein ED92_11075 [Amycolatopsis sp. MJM2582]
MSENDDNLDDLVGSRIVVIYRKSVWSAISEVFRALGPDKAANLKVNSGEHLAAVLATAFLGSPPVEADHDGGPDLVFSLQNQTLLNGMVGPEDAPFADFEIKSLPGPARQFNAAIEKARRQGRDPRTTEMTIAITSADAMLTDAKAMITAAAAQLERKSSPDRARNVFLVTHPFDHFYAEIADYFLTHRLPALSDLPDSVDAVWLLAFPSHLAVWSVAQQEWITLYFADANENEQLPGSEDDLEFLAAVDLEFCSHLGPDKHSPYGIKLTFE